MTDVIQKARSILEKYPDPSTGKPIEAAGRVIALRLESNILKFILEFNTSSEVEDFAGLKVQLEEELRNIDEIENVQIVSTVTTNSEPSSNSSPSQSPPKPKPDSAPSQAHKIKRIYAIGSGKGGVGKSTVTANLAVALALKGKKIGLLDADFYGPSQVMMMGTKTKPQSKGDLIVPTRSHNVKMVSLAQMIEEGEAIIWRGPMLMKALEQLLNGVVWGELDALLIDLPPGTGDVQLSLAQKAKLSGAFVVTTPQDIALLDARRALSMFEKLKVPALGIIENMAIHICSNCGHEDHIFGDGGAQKEANERNIPFLGSLPLSRPVREGGDQGVPIALNDESSIFHEIASRMIAGKLV